MALGGGFRNAVASPAPPLLPYNLSVAPLDSGSARGVLEDEMCLGGGGGADRRKKRLMKNRESAGRARARKQAYVRELEKKVQMLQEENDSLRVENDQLRASVEVAVPIVKKTTLQRTPSAPF